MKKRFIVIIYFTAMVLGYTFLKPEVESFVSAKYYEYVDRELVAAMPRTTGFDIGFYKPELPLVYSDLQKTEKKINTKASIVSIYQAWGERKEHQFNHKHIKKITKKGYIPMITWEPWLGAFSEFYEKEPDNNLQKIANGAVDWFIRDYARSIVKFGKPIYIRYAHEMTNPWYSWSSNYNNSPEAYIASWKHVVNIFREEGATNVSFVWTPYTEKDEAYYPGYDYVDVIGLDIFNFGSIVTGMDWKSFNELVEPMHKAYTPLNKPIILAELGTSSYGGDKGDWLVDMFELLSTETFSNIHRVIIFDNPIWHNDNGLEIDWSISENEDILKKLNGKITRRKQ